MSGLVNTSLDFRTTQRMREGRNTWPNQEPHLDPVSPSAGHSRPIATCGPRHLEGGLRGVGIQLPGGFLVLSLQTRLPIYPPLSMSQPKRKITLNWPTGEI